MVLQLLKPLFDWMVMVWFWFCIAHRSCHWYQGGKGILSCVQTPTRTPWLWDGVWERGHRQEALPCSWYRCVWCNVVQVAARCHSLGAWFEEYGAACALHCGVRVPYMLLPCANTGAPNPNWKQVRWKSLIWKKKIEWSNLCYYSGKEVFETNNTCQLYKMKKECTPRIFVFCRWCLQNEVKHWKQGFDVSGDTCVIQSESLLLWEPAICVNPI